MKSEIEERLIAQEEISEQMIKRIGELEKRDYPDYAASTAELQKIALTVSGQVAIVEALVSTMPKAIEMKHRYTLDLKTKSWVIGLVIWVIAFVIVLGLYISLRSENVGLKVNDLKYRAIRQVFPVQTDWADKLYQEDPDHLLRVTDSLEEAAKVRAHAEDIAEQSIKDAREAKEKLEELKKKMK